MLVLLWLVAAGFEVEVAVAGVHVSNSLGELDISCSGCGCGACRGFE